MDRAIRARHRLRRLILVLSLTAPAGALGSQAASPSVAVPRLAEPLRLADFRGMRAPDLELTRVEGFIQRVPRDGASATETTEVYLGYDDEGLHVVFLCFDESPDAIRARLVARGNAIDVDDFVSLQLDTFRDERRAYSFSANPRGVQKTAMWIEGEGWDDSFDTVWFAEGQLTERGYIVSMFIPFRSLRFPPASAQSWGVLFQRSIPRNNEESYWPHYSSRIDGRLNQAALLTGIRDVSPGRNVQLIPHSVVRSADVESVDAGVHGDIGLDAKAVLNDSIVVDATLNPDFSQVESDEPQVQVNQRFELFFPEKRPFFLENASFFQTPVNLLFTRRIANPSAGVRVTGKLGAYAFGALVSDDRARGELGEDAFFSAFRLSRDLGRQSSLGVLYAERRSGAHENRAFGIDGRLKIDANWTADLQAARSETDGVEGSAYEVRVSRAGRKLNYDLELEDRSPGFHTETGFEPRSDYRSMKHLVRYRLRPEGERLIAFGPDLLAQRLWDYEGTELELTYGPAFHFELSRQTSFGIYYLDSRETLRPSDHPSLEDTRTYSRSQWGLLFSSAYLPQVRIEGGYASGDGVNLFPAGTSPPESARSHTAELGLSVRPRASLTIDNRYLWTRLEEREGSGILFDNHILRSAWNYQLTPPLSIRVILQYESLAASRELTSLEPSKNVNFDLLVRYVLNYGTALYVGYNENLRGLDPRSPTGLRRDSRQFFFKLSYLFRL